MSTITASFTAVDDVSVGLLVAEGQSATCGASGTYEAAILLERTRDGGQTWETITSSDTEDGTVSEVVTTPGTYRWRCTDYTAGTVDISSSTDAVTLFGPIRNAAGVVVFEVTSDGPVTDGTPSGFGAALEGFTGASNTGLGTAAGDSLTSGTDNTALGVNALTAQIAGSHNVAVGKDALLASTGDSHNVAVGDSALKDMDGGSNNVGIGADAAQNITLGTDNVIIGFAAAQNATTADDSVMIGRSSGATLSTGDKNTALGAYAGDEITTGTGNAAIGYQAGKGQGNVSNKFMVGLGNGQGLIFTIDEGGNALGLTVRYADGTMHAIVTPLALTP